MNNLKKCFINIVYSLLTPSLYMEIASDKNSEIVSLKEKKINVLEKLKQEILILKELKLEKKAINLKIKNSKRILKADRKEKFKLSRQLNKEQKLSSMLNLLIKKEETYIFVSDFYQKGGKKTR